MENKKETWVKPTLKVLKIKKATLRQTSNSTLTPG